MRNFIDKIEQIQVQEFKITKGTKGEQIQQTQRNNLKADLVQAIYDLFASNYDYVYRSKDGVLLEIANESIADNVSNELGSGAITVCIDLKVMGLETDARAESEDYVHTLKEKALKNEKKAKDKADKIAYDEKRRKGE